MASSYRDSIPSFSKGRKIYREMLERENGMNRRERTKMMSSSSLQTNLRKRRRKIPGGWRWMGEGKINDDGHDRRRDRGRCRFDCRGYSNPKTTDRGIEEDSKGAFIGLVYDVGVGVRNYDMIEP